MKIKKKTLFIHQFIFTCLLFFPASAFCFADGLTYEFSGQLAMQFSGYYGDEDPENGFVLPDNEYLVRKAALTVHGNYGKYISFAMEFGSEKCPFSSSDNVKFLEAQLFFLPFDNFKIGFSKGHVLRGYHLNHDCTDLMTAEKVRWSSNIAGCHPTGMLASFEHEFSENSGLELEVSYNNGPNSNTLGDEHDLNFGVHYRTHLNGLSISGFYSDIEADFNLDQVIDNGERIGIGARFDNGKFIIGSEYYVINGGVSLYEDIDSSDLEMRAYYVESSYIFNTDKIVSYVQPYARFQSWDKGSNVKGDHEFHYMDFGIKTGIDQYDAFFSVEYQTRISEPDGAIDEPDKFILRFQINI
ncbi:hypothetical protein K8T06_16200 [bacterium]|nr:hypothetical protein [bacterium]